MAAAGARLSWGWILFGALAALLSLRFATGAAEPAAAAALPAAAAGGAAPARVIEVDGVAQLDVVPDLLDLVLTIQERAPSPAAAAAAVEKKRAAVLAALEGSGVARDALVVSHLNLSPWWDDDRTRPRGYDAALTLIATVAPERLAATAEAAVGAGANGLSTRFRASDLPARKRTLRDMALKAAREKADQMAAAMGVTAGAVVTLREDAGGGGWGWGGGMGNVAAFDRGPASSDEDGELRPDAIRLSLTVHAVFALE